MSSVSRFQGEADVWTVGSDSKEAVTYAVYRVKNRDDAWWADRCSCPAFQYHEQPCKHLRRLGNTPDAPGVRNAGSTGIIDIVDMMSKAFTNGLNAGLELGRKAERSGR